MAKWWYNATDIEAHRGNLVAAIWIRRLLNNRYIVRFVFSALDNMAVYPLVRAMLLTALVLCVVCKKPTRDEYNMMYRDDVRNQSRQVDKMKETINDENGSLDYHIPVRKQTSECLKQIEMICQTFSFLVALDMPGIITVIVRFHTCTVLLSLLYRMCEYVLFYILSHLSQWSHVLDQRWEYEWE